MNEDRVLIDTGPLVAILNARDTAHPICAGLMPQFRLPLLTTWAVIAEAAWLLRNVPHGVPQLLGLIDAGIVACPELGFDAARWMSDVIAKYADLHPQLADVSLLYLAEREDITDVFTLDRRDFTVYHTSNGQSFTLHPVV